MPAIYLAAQAPDPRASKPSAVSGQVINGDTREPIPNVHVVFDTSRYPNDPNSQGKAFGAVSDADGRFSVAAVDPGAYFINASAPGFIPTGGAPLKVQNGEAVQSLDVKLYPAATISGRVVDEHGDPVERMNVEVVGVGKFAVSTATTDDRGEFRMRGLFGGKYLLRAVPSTERNSAGPEIRSDGTTEEAYQPTFYPASIAKEGATRVEAHAGSASLRTSIQKDKRFIVATNRGSSP